MSTISVPNCIDICYMYTIEKLLPQLTSKRKHIDVIWSTNDHPFRNRLVCSTPTMTNVKKKWWFQPIHCSPSIALLSAKDLRWPKTPKILHFWELLRKFENRVCIGLYGVRINHNQYTAYAAVQRRPMHLERKCRQYIRKNVVQMESRNNECNRMPFSMLNRFGSKRADTTIQYHSTLLRTYIVQRHFRIIIIRYSAKFCHYSHCFHLSQLTRVEAEEVVEFDLSCNRIQERTYTQFKKHTCEHTLATKFLFAEHLSMFGKLVWDFSKTLQSLYFVNVTKYDTKQFDCALSLLCDARSVSTVSNMLSFSWIPISFRSRMLGEWA